MTDSPLFSVLMANYNNGRYLMESVDSVQEQSYDHWEIIIVDDGSTDHSEEVFGALAGDPRIHIFRNDRNRGAGFTKRRCVELAQGELCAFVDPDDVLSDKDALAIMVQAHRDHPDASMVYSGFYDADENLVITGERRGVPLRKGVSALESCTWPFKVLAAFKKEKYDLTAGVDPLMKRAVDYDMYYKLEEVGEMVFVDKVLYCYRHNSNSISLNSGEYKSRAWHSYTCVEAMKRRGLTDEKLMLFPIEDALRTEYKKGVDHMKGTKTYRVGEAVLRPVKWIFRLFGKSI